MVSSATTWFATRSCLLSPQLWSIGSILCIIESSWWRQINRHSSGFKPCPLQVGVIANHVGVDFFSMIEHLPWKHNPVAEALSKKSGVVMTIHATIVLEIQGVAGSAWRTSTLTLWSLVLYTSLLWSEIRATTTFETDCSYTRAICASLQAFEQ